MPFILHRTLLLFASSGDVLRYNVTGRLFGKVISRILVGLPTIIYVDDFGLPTRASISADATFSFKKSAGLIGVFLKGSKTEVANKIICLAMSAHSPCPDSVQCLDIPPMGRIPEIVFSYPDRCALDRYPKFHVAINREAMFRLGCDE